MEHSPKIVEAPVLEVPAPRQISTLEAMQVQAIVQEIHSRQKLGQAALAGLVAALVCAYIWALITVSFNFQIGWMAVGIGFVVGWVVFLAGKGVTPVFGYVGALLSLFGCLAGNVLMGAMVIADEYAMPIQEVLNAFLTAPQTMIEVLRLTFSPMDLLFYAIALYYGYRHSFRTIDEDAIAGAVLAKQSSIAQLP